MYQSVVEEAWGLVHSLASLSNTPDGFGTMSPAAYDTAWVAMTEKRDKDGKLRPLFPEAYSYLEQTQSQDGSWAADSSDTDGIVNTLAALLALKKQERQQVEELRTSQSRCHAAEASLRRMLERWDLDSADRVGMELLVPNLLRLLEDQGVCFDFPCRKALLALNAAKMVRLGPALTSPEQTSLTHSLEAFVGTLDFNRMKFHQMPNGSMLASPSSTAAYLMNASEWDDEAEAYLHMVFQQQSKLGHEGGFPSAYPSTIFETCWVLSTLLESGFSKDDFLMADSRSLTTLLELNLKQGKGLAGWAPYCLPDVDDTAKTISVLSVLGWEKEIEPMLRSFESDSCFITYQGERNPSVSANCNVLSCLLQTRRPAAYTKQIVKCASFITKTFMHNTGPDKWHTSGQYPMMLTAQALLLMLKRWAKNELDSETVPQSLVYQDIPRILLDILSTTMRAQQDDGSWDSKREVTAYAVLTLAPLLSLPWVDFMRSEGVACMYRGKAYLEKHRNQWRVAEHIWVEKTVYGSPNLAQAYCLAATRIVVPATIVCEKISDIFPPATLKKMTKMSLFFARVPPFLTASNWQLRLSLLQSASYTAALKAHRYDIFPPIETASDEKYQEYIPFTWIGCKDYLSTSISSQTLWQMMLVSMFNFQVDAFMETVVRSSYGGRLHKLKELIRSLCNDQPGRPRENAVPGSKFPTKSTNGPRTGATNGQCSLLHDDSVDTRDEDIEKVLAKFVEFALHHSRVLASPAPMRKWLAYELQTFLLAHVTHMEDCDALSHSTDSAHGSTTWSRPRTTFFDWVRTTSADHTSCPYSFVFFLCLVGDGGRSLRFSMQQRYTLEDACCHLAAMCRQYNDLGSTVRDQEEGNLNSVNFPEFIVDETDTKATAKGLTDRKKQELLAVAEYERRCLDRALEELELGTDSRLMAKLRLLVQVTDLYGQVYVVRDIGIVAKSAIKQRTGMAVNVNGLADGKKRDSLERSGGEGIA